MAWPVFAVLHWRYVARAKPALYQKGGQIRSGKLVRALAREFRRFRSKPVNYSQTHVMPYRCGSCHWLELPGCGFDPARAPFDVVLVDEAESVPDITGLLAWYLGALQVVVVGDHEQVSPLAVGQNIDNMDQLIAQHLTGVPNSHLYDGKTSIYDLARQSFGGTIALREHFRCVPDIIEFSNALSYGGDIRPLRDASMVARPHVVEFIANTTMGSGRTGKGNESEARAVVALVQAVSERPEYEGKTLWRDHLTRR